MFDDCIGLVQSCIASKAQNQKLDKLPLKPSHKFESPFHYWVIAYFLKLATTEVGYSHVLVCVNVYTKWVKLIPMKTENTVDVW